MEKSELSEFAWEGLNCKIFYGKINEQALGDLLTHFHVYSLGGFFVSYLISNYS